MTAFYLTIYNWLLFNLNPCKLRLIDGVKCWAWESDKYGPAGCCDMRSYAEDKFIAKYGIFKVTKAKRYGKPKNYSA